MIDPTPEFRRLIAARADERGLRLSQQDVIEILAYVEAMQGQQGELNRRIVELFVRLKKELGEERTP